MALFGQSVLPAFMLRSAGMATSVLQDAGVTLTASQGTVSLDALLSCLQKPARKAGGSAREHTVYSNYDATQISAASESEPTPHPTPEK